VQDSAHPSGKSKQTALFNLRDLNFFIKNIEKDMTDKFSKLGGGCTSGNSKDFNSMPTTPTSILKKVGDQMKLLA
jgi:hypothetical protein